MNAEYRRMFRRVENVRLEVEVMIDMAQCGTV